jgi:hypothetical protein
MASLLYVGFLADTQIAGFFSASAQMGIGVLVALAVELRSEAVAMDPETWQQAEARARALLLAAIGSTSSLIGTLITGSAIVSGLPFALTWGGTMAGVASLTLLVLNRFDRSWDRGRAGERDVDG